MPARACEGAWRWGVQMPQARMMCACVGDPAMSIVVRKRRETTQPNGGTRHRQAGGGCGLVPAAWSLVVGAWPRCRGAPTHEATQVSFAEIYEMSEDFLASQSSPFVRLARSRVSSHPRFSKYCMDRYTAIPFVEPCTVVILLLLLILKSLFSNSVHVKSFRRGSGQCGLVLRPPSAVCIARVRETTRAQGPRCQTRTARECLRRVCACARTHAPDLSEHHAPLPNGERDGSEDRRGHARRGLRQSILLRGPQRCPLRAAQRLCGRVGRLRALGCQHDHGRSLGA
jgi:hypothetical protein